ncbi:G-protein coupled receptor 171 [Aplochiton taeniatus]
MALPNSSANTTPPTPCVINDQMGAFTILYFLIFFLGLFGNLLALCAFFTRCHSSLTRSTDVYLVNLLTSDLLLTLALPFKIAKDLGVASWRMMVFHCQVSAVVIYISLYASIFLLAFISVDRYLQVTKRQRVVHVQKPGFAWLMSAVLWSLLLLLMVPNMALPTHSGPETKLLSCSSLKKGVGLSWHTLAVFLCMGLFLNASSAVLLSNSLVLKRLLHSRNDAARWSSARQATVNIVVVTLAYVVGFVPYHVVRTPYTLVQTKVITDCATKRHLFLAKESTLLLAVLHLCFDPILYFYLSKSFRQSLSKVFSSKKKRLASSTGAPTDTPRTIDVNEREK